MDKDAPELHAQPEQTSSRCENASPDLTVTKTPLEPSPQQPLFSSSAVMAEVERRFGRAAQTYFVESVWDVLPDVRSTRKPRR